MFDWFEGAPEWATVVIYWKDMGWIFYLETDEKGVEGRVARLEMSAPIVFGEFNEHHVWWESGNQEQVVARRGDAMARPRYLTDEEVAILKDLGMLEEALKQQGVEMPPAEETFLQVNVWSPETGSVYDFDEVNNEGDDATTVEKFFNVVEHAYNKLGFQNKVTISADFGTTGFNKVLGES